MVAESTRNEEERRDFKQTSEWQGLILNTIGQNGHDREIISRLREGESVQSIADWLVTVDPTYKNLGSEPTIKLTLTEVVQMFEEQCKPYDGRPWRDTLFSSKISWTKVTSDHKLTGHLLDLYFTWVHPVHMLFSEKDFIRDYGESTIEEGSAYCGSALVNAICAMACQLLDNKMLQRGSELVDIRRNLDEVTLREGFMEEVKRRLAHQPNGRLTSIQAFAIMFLVDWGAGKTRNALGYLRVAAEHLNDLDRSQSEEAREITFWGINTLIT